MAFTPMSPTRTERLPGASADEIRAMLSLRETALLAEIPEAKVRKDIETGLLARIRAANVERLMFRWADVYIFGAVYKGGLLSSSLRKKVFEEFEDLLEPSCRRSFYDFMDAEALALAKCARLWPHQLFASCDRLRLHRYFFIDVGRVVEDLAPRVALYADGLSRIEEREGVLGGEIVFRNTRLSVKHIGKMRDGGEPIESIVEDYPYLRRSDVEFARLYHKAHPMVGRPPNEEGVDVAGHSSSR